MPVVIIYQEIPWFHCPGCDDKHQFKGWDWNGDLEKPTINPSILVKYYNGNVVEETCHSFVKEGKIQFLSDCTHALAGKTVNLPVLPVSMVKELLMNEKSARLSGYGDFEYEDPPPTREDLIAQARLALDHASIELKEAREAKELAQKRVIVAGEIVIAAECKLMRLMNEKK